MKFYFDKNGFRAYLLILSLAAVWTAGPLVAPIVAAHGLVSPEPYPAFHLHPPLLPDLLSVIMEAVYGRVCHQLPARSLWIQGHPMAVCARCFGIYVGYFAGLLIYPLAGRRLEAGLPRRRWLILALLPLAVDFAAGCFGLFENTIASRSMTGLIAGIAGAVYTAPGLIAATGAALAGISAWRVSMPLSKCRGAHNG